MLGLARDFRYTLRLLAKSPVFAAVAILTVALGVGANTAVFSVMNAVLLRALPVPNPQQLVYFHLENQPTHSSSSGYHDMSLSIPVFEAMRARRDVFQDVIGFVPLSFDKVAVRIGSQPEEAHGEMVSGNFFATLQIQPFLGRAFTRDDESAHANVAIINFAWWKTRFSGDSQILGRTIYVKGVPFTIVGVAPPGFAGIDPDRSEMNFWIPLQARPELNAWGMSANEGTLYGTPNWLVLMLLGRLQPGVTAKQAEQRLTPDFRATLAIASPPASNEPPPGLELSELRGRESLRRDYEYPLRALMSMVALVLVIACANVILLLLARNSGRLAEFSLRQALGANRRALFLQLLQESFLLVACGSFLGWLFSRSATAALTAWSNVNISVEPDQRVLFFTTAISLLVILAFALAPLPFLTRLPLNLALRSSGGAAGSARNRLWGRKLVVALQISLCAVLLSAAGLLYRTLRNLESSDLGMRTAGLLVFGVTPQSGVATDTDAVRFHTALLERMRGLPGVDSATLTEVRLGSGGSDNNAVLVDGRNPLPERRFAPLRSNSVGPNFLSTLGIPLLRGRDISASDTADSPKVAIVNQTFADRYLPGVSPLGHHVSVLGDTSQYTIVGVAANSRYTSITEDARAIAYVPITQASGVLGMQYELYTYGNPKLLIPEAAALLREVDPNLPLEKPMTQQDQFAESISQERLVANLSAFFGLLAVFLVAIGLYATVSYAVNRRTMEIGVRMALGAQRRQVLLMVLRENLFVAAAGIAVGVPLSLALARALRSMLYGLSPADPLALLGAFAGIAAITVAAAFFPAYRAASIEPTRALRMD